MPESAPVQLRNTEKNKHCTNLLPLDSPGLNSLFIHILNNQQIISKKKLYKILLLYLQLSTGTGISFFYYNVKKVNNRTLFSRILRTFCKLKVKLEPGGNQKTFSGKIIQYRSDLVCVWYDVARLVVPVVPAGCPPGHLILGVAAPLRAHRLPLTRPSLQTKD